MSLTTLGIMCIQMRMIIIYKMLSSALVITIIITRTFLLAFARILRSPSGQSCTSLCNPDIPRTPVLGYCCIAISEQQVVHSLVHSIKSPAKLDKSLSAIPILTWCSAHQGFPLRGYSFVIVLDMPASPC